LKKITGNILDENDKAANMLKCGVDKSPDVVAEISERVKNEMLVWKPHFFFEKYIYVSFKFAGKCSSNDQSANSSVLSILLQLHC
jgi:hypothetical protein